MSALGQKRTLSIAVAMSAMGPRRPNSIFRVRQRHEVLQIQHDGQISSV
jgi:hypothetical protein